jgi:hypothetical protein
MAAVNKTIGTTGRDYSTFTLWEADDGGGDGLGNDACTGSAYNDSVFDETWTINFSALNIVQTVAAGERHDGTAGTGARVVRSGSGTIVTQGAGANTEIEWLELDGNGNATGAGCVADSENGDFFRRLILHGGASSAGMTGLGSGGANKAVDCLSYNHASTNTGASQAAGFRFTSTFSNGAWNCTSHDITNDNGSGPSYGFSVADDLDSTIKNCISTDASGTTSGAVEDFANDSPANADIEYNLSSDATASGTGSLINKAAADQFVSTSPVNLHLKAGADAIDAGTDLGTTPSGVEIDIDGWNRDSDTPSRDPWDMGAHEYEPAAAAGKPWYAYAQQVA